MSEFTETIKVVVQSVFNSDGFDKLERRMANLMNTRDNLEKQFNRGIGMKNIKSEIEQVEDRFKEAGLEIQTFKDEVSDVEKKVSEAGSNSAIDRQGIQVADDGGESSEAEFETRDFSNSIDEMFEAADEANLADQIVDNSTITDNIEVAKEQLQELGFVVQDMETGTPVMPGEQVDRLADAANRLDKFGGFDQQNMMAGVVPDETDIENLGAMDRTLGESLQNFSLPSPDQTLRDDLANTLTTGASGQIGGEKINVRPLNARALGVLSAEMSQLGEASQIASTDLQRLVRNRLPEMDQGMRQAASSTRSLQMRLLGLQFTMLTVAFIFGGVMASALGAVGAFQILGNTLKFLFLPTALDLLDPLLSLQDTVFNLDEETRRFIGRIFGLITAGSIAIGVFAALAQPLVGLIGLLMSVGGKLGLISALGSLGGALMTVGGMLRGLQLGSLLSVLKGGGILAALKAKFLAIGAAISSVATPVLILIGIITALFVIFRRFPKIADAITSLVMGAFDLMIGFLTATFELLITQVKGLFNILTGIFTSLFALITGDTKKFKKGLQEILFGIGQFFVEPFEDVLNLFGQHIVPGFFDVAKDIITGMVDVFTQNGSALQNALISILPAGIQGIARNALSGAGQGVRNFVDNAVSGLDNIGDDFKKFDFKIGKDFKRKNTKSKAKKENKDNNSVNVENLNTSLNINEGNESPRETSRRAGRELRRGMVNKGSNFATGT